MNEDAVLTFEVKLSASSSSEIKNLIAEAKQAKEENAQDRANLSAQKKLQREQNDIDKDFASFYKRIEREEIKAEKDHRKMILKQAKQYSKQQAKQQKADDDEDELIADLLKQLSGEAEDEAIALAGFVPPSRNLAGKITGGLDDIDNHGVNNLKQFAQNPAGMIGNQLLGMLGRAGPYGALAAAIISIVISAPELYKAVIEALAAKGAPLNQDWRMSMEEQNSLGFDRALQFRRITGDSPIITVDTHGYIAGDPSFTGNSLVDSEITRTNRIGIQNQSLHFWNGI